MYFLFRLPVRVLLLLFALLCSLVRQRLWITVELMISASDCCLHRAELLRLNRNFAVRFLSEMITRGVCRFYFPRNCLPKRFQSDIYSISFFSCCCFFFWFVLSDWFAPIPLCNFFFNHSFLLFDCGV